MLEKRFASTRSSWSEVWTNLLRNAEQARRQISIHIEGHQEGGWAIVTVSDNGPGMSQEILNRIFERYFTTKESGTGIGLWLVREIIENAGGTIQASSRLGEGTTFTIRLPVIPTAPAGFIRDTRWGKLFDLVRRLPWGYRLGGWVLWLAAPSEAVFFEDIPPLVLSIIRDMEAEQMLAKSEPTPRALWSSEEEWKNELHRRLKGRIHGGEDPALSSSFADQHGSEVLVKGG